MARAASSRHLALVALAGLPFVSVAIGSPEFTVVALTGTDGPLGPGLGPNVIYWGVGHPETDNAGNLLFSGVVQGPSYLNSASSTSFGVPSNAPVILAETDVVAGGSFSGSASTPSLHEARNGTVLQAGFIDDGFVFLCWESGAWTEFYRAGTGPAPGLPQWVDEADWHWYGQFEGGSTPIFNDAGFVAMTTKVFGDASAGYTTDWEGVWTGVGAPTTRIAFEDAPVPGSGGAEDWLKMMGPSLAPDNSIAFHAEIGPFNGPRRDAFFVGDTSGFGALTRIAAENETAPGAGGDLFGEIDFTRANVADSGVVAFAAYVSSTDPQRTRGLWHGDANSLALLSRSGDPADGFGPGAFITDFHDVNLRSDGSLSYVEQGDLGGSEVFAVRTGSPGDMKTALKTLDGALHPTDPTETILEPYAVASNASGDLVIVATTISGLARATNTSLFAWNDSLGATRIAGTDDVIEVGPGDMRTISEIAIRTAHPRLGVADALGDDGLLTFRVRFTDNSLAILAANVASNIADLNGDGGVDGADIAVILASWGSCAGCPADLNGDGVVSGGDIAVLLANWTQ